MLRWLMHRIAGYVHRQNTVDRFRGHPRKAEAIGLVTAKRWQQLETLYAALRVDERHVVTAGLAQSAREGAFDTWVGASGAAVAHSMKGHLELDLAWRARTGGMGSVVTDEAAKKFFAHLGTAFESLRSATRLEPSDSEPFSGIIRTLMGLGDYVGAMHDWFDSIEGTHLPAANHLLDALTAKWRGSDQQMFAFARTSCERNPAYGSLVALAHAEHWFASDGPDRDAKKYFTKPDVREEITAAYERDALLGDHELAYFALMARSVYAFAFSKMGDRARASKELGLVGRYITEKPWVYGSMFVFKGLAAARNACGLAPIGKG